MPKPSVRPYFLAFNFSLLFHTSATFFIFLRFSAHFHRRCSHTALLVFAILATKPVDRNLIFVENFVFTLMTYIEARLMFILMGGVLRS